MGSPLVSKFLMNTVKRDVSSVEACFELSALPLFRSTHSFVNLSITGNRLFEKNGETISKSTLVDKYLKRPNDDTSSLYEFACKGHKVPVITGDTKASWPLNEAFCRSALILHWSNWRNIQDITKGRNWVQVFEEFLESSKCPNFVKAEVSRATKQCNESVNDLDDQEETPSQQQYEDPEWMDLVRPNPEYEQELNDFLFDDGGPDFNWSENEKKYPLNTVDKWFEKLETNYEDGDLDIPDVDFGTLNNDQLFAFNIIMKTLQNYKTGNSEYTPMRLIIGGTAGSGKSYLIKSLVKAVRLLFNSNKSIQVLCPTGNSANIIGGRTLHSFLKLPISKRNGEMKMPSGDKAKELQRNCEGLEVLLVDERSLIGATTLGWMEFLCGCGMKNGSRSDETWGGLPVVAFFGDDVQLPPVLESAIYYPNPSIPAARHGAMVWEEFKHAVILKSIVRQNGNEQAMFRNVLNGIRLYQSSPEDISWLQKFQWEDLRKT